MDNKFMNEKQQTCKRCNGRGVIRDKWNTNFWEYDWINCPACNAPRNADQSLDNPENKAALAQFFSDLAELDADRAENAGTPQYDNLGFEIGRKPPTDPRDL